MGPVATRGQDIILRGPGENQLELWGQDRGWSGSLSSNGKEFQIELTTIGEHQEGSVSRNDTKVGACFAKSTGEGWVLILSGDIFSGNEDPSGLYKELDAAARLALAKKAHSKADVELNATYKKLMGGLNKERQGDLRERQRAWIGYRDHMAEHPTNQSETPKEKNEDYWHTLAELTDARVDFLRAYGLASVPDSPVGVYIDEFGGQLVIRESDDKKLLFEVEVVRGPTYHLGNLEGVAVRAGAGDAKFTDTEKDAFEDGKPGTLEFGISPRIITLKEKGLGHYHGARASFDGEYFRTEDPLPPVGADREP